MSDTIREIAWVRSSLPIWGMTNGGLDRRAPPHPDFFVADGDITVAIETTEYVACPGVKAAEVAAHELVAEAYQRCAAENLLRGLDLFVDLKSPVISRSKRSAFIGKVIAEAQKVEKAKDQINVDGVDVTIDKCQHNSITLWTTDFNTGFIGAQDAAIAAAIKRKRGKTYSTTASKTVLVIHPGIGGVSQMVGAFIGVNTSSLKETIAAISEVNKTKFASVAILNDRGQALVVHVDGGVHILEVQPPSLRDIYVGN